MGSSDDFRSNPGHWDVRMRGFARRARVTEVVRWLDEHVRPLDEAQSVPLAEAVGRVLAHEAVAGLDVPPFDRAAMDGYALRGEETIGAGPYNPLPFRVVGQALPGRPFEGEVLPGTAVRITTGAPLPAGADAVVPAEFTRESGDVVEVTEAVPPSRHVGRKGEDVRAGSVVLPRGRRLRPQDVALLASVGFDSVPVLRRPRVRIIATGNELVPPGLERRPFEIYDANTSLLRALVERDGGEAAELVHVGDDRSSIRQMLVRPGVDVVLVSGGTSVGQEDWAPLVLAEEGELAFHGVAMRPASPTGVGRLGEAFVFLLPGHPVSCLCAYDFFAGRCVRRLAGLPADWPYPARRARLKSKLVSAIGRVDYCRVRTNVVQAEPLEPWERPRTNEPLLEAEPLAVSGASVLSSTTRADGFVVVPEPLEGFPAQAEVTVFLYDPQLELSRRPPE